MTDTTYAQDLALLTKHTEVVELAISRNARVAVAPAWQGRGLSKPMLAAACARLRDLGHSRGVLTTQTVRSRAVGLYLRFGFGPEIVCPADAAAWRLVATRLPPDLAAVVAGHLERAET